MVNKVEIANINTSKLPKLDAAQNKELFLNELDLILPLGLIFSHEYENDKLKVIFKEVQ